MPAARRTPPAQPLTDAERPDWFRAFLTDRATRKPSAHTLQAYRQDFDAIAADVAGGRDRISSLTPPHITKDSMRQAFATYAETHEAASIRRCWSTWNVLCSYLYTAELLAANPMQFIGRPKPDRALPKSLHRSATQVLVAAVGQPSEVKRPSEWPERDRAIILTALLAGLRAAEIRGANVGDLRLTDNGGGLLHVRGKGNKDRAVPIEHALVEVLNSYLISRAVRFPASTGRRSPTGPLFGRWPATAPLFVGADGHRITRGALQYRVLRAFKRAGADAGRTPGALVHALRHTYATELAAADVSVYALMKLLGHESMATSQRYVSAAGTETRSAAALNPLYELARDDPDDTFIKQTRRRPRRHA
jgi:integrase/recombinase XerC